MKIIFLDSHTLSLNDDVDFTPIKKLGNYTGYTLTENDDVISCSKNANVIITNKIIIDSGIMDKLSNLKLICVIATGYNNVDVKAARDHRITVVNVPQYAKYSVSQHTFTLILNLVSKVYLYHKDVQNGHWSKSDSFTLLKYPTFELVGKTIGIIGFGAIGKEVATIAEAFKMVVLVYDIFNISASGYKNSRLDEILINSDIVSIHCPLTDKTKDLIEKKAFSKMKKDAFLINTSRGGIVNEKDLAEALNSGKIAGAGFDVLSKEPPLEDNPLLGGVKNLILTPHTAWSTVEARQRMIDITSQNIKSFIKGEILNIVSLKQ